MFCTSFRLKTDESTKKAGTTRSHHSYPYDGHHAIEYVHTNIPTQRNAAKFLRSLMVTRLIGTGGLCVWGWGVGGGRRYMGLMGLW